MKIGLSYSRCVRDIIDGVVDINDVLVIISRTSFDPHNDAQWSGIWQGYRSGVSLSNPEWQGYPADDEQKFRDVSIALWDQGKFHQPRMFGAYPRRLPYFWLETTLPGAELDKNPAAKAAWEKFLSVAFLSGVDVKEGQG